MRKFLMAVVSVMVLAALLAGYGIAQEEKKVEASARPKAEPKEESIYGEVLSVNDSANTMTVQYYDYDTDEEKDLEVGVTKDTKFENAPSLKDVKKGDWVDVSYSAQGEKKIAGSISVEREEEEEVLAAPAESEETAVKK